MQLPWAASQLTQLHTSALCATSQLLLPLLLVLLRKLRCHHQQQLVKVPLMVRLLLVRLLLVRLLVLLLALI